MSALSQQRTAPQPSAGSVSYAGLGALPLLVALLLALALGACARPGVEDVAPQPSATPSPTTAADEAPTPEEVAAPIDTPQPSTTPAATSAPQPTNTPAPPTATATEAVTVPPTAVPTPTATCAVAIHADLLDAWEEAGGKRRLGCPYTPAQEEAWGAQLFERGVMLWRGVYGTIYVGRGDGSFVVSPDYWEEGTPEYTCHVEAPGGLRQPKRGFGLLWCRSEAERDALGFATEEEHPITGLAQQFEGGLLFWEYDYTVRAFYSDGTWIDLGPR